ncbi:hypothetical protein ACFOET_02300 [Parapedobacter deserti]|uniref:Uncharacterized protein n=1 Tax=Parapedobacter deserti TaxID=1912957 RepID=A0ABV7JM70_9SPHI
MNALLTYLFVLSASVVTLAQSTVEARKAEYRHLDGRQLYVSREGREYTVDLPFEEGMGLDLQLSGDGEILVISGRYEAVLYHPDSLQVSGLICPGEDEEYREDAISGTLGGLHHDGVFLTGNAVGYGLFCMDVTDWNRPVELLRVSCERENNGQPYLFLKESDQGGWDGFATASDTASLSPHLHGHYTRTLPLRTVFSRMQVDTTAIWDPLEKPIQTLELRDAEGHVFRLNMPRLECGEDLNNAVHTDQKLGFTCPNTEIAASSVSAETEKLTENP